MKSRQELKRNYQERLKPAGVFQVKNTITGKLLLGSSLNLDGALNGHRFSLTIGSHRNMALQHDWNSSGSDAFTFAVLEVVKHKVWHSHASDRFPGKYDHSVIGEGSVDFDPIFACLAEIGYNGYISLEDNNPEGHEGSRRAVAFIRRKVAEHWPAA